MKRLTKFQIDYAEGRARQILNKEYASKYVTVPERPQYDVIEVAHKLLKSKKFSVPTKEQMTQYRFSWEQIIPDSAIPGLVQWKKDYEKASVRNSKLTAEREEELNEFMDKLVLGDAEEALRMLDGLEQGKLP